MNKNDAKETIKQLLEKYELAKTAGKIPKYSEEETKRGFIEPLFHALGWDFSSKEEVSLEEQISGDRVDYGFYLNGRIKFYLEAKKISSDLRREDYAKQAIRYSWNKGVTWAVLSDFETLIVFNALSPEKSLAGKQYLSFACQDYLTRFDELWNLSKEAFGNDVLDNEAERVGKKLQKVSVTETLSKDLNECREILTEAFSRWNEKIDSQLIDEGVQKLLNRLIFIRCAEDRKIEPPTLIPLIHEWKSSGLAGRVTLYQAMVKKFRELDVVYNSNLFGEHSFEKWEEFEGATEKVIDILYGKKNYFDYDFSIIPADVLGNVYENYLGYKLQQSKRDLFGEHLELSKNLKKRKEQGIYYTPKFIVDYIVQNALGPVLNECKTITDLQKIKILDPACGSGSFLVAAINLLIRKYEEFGAKANGLLKIQILQNNIYGVDLDQQAVELTRLNLLLNTFDSQIKLPNLGANIKNGNSLISGSDEELEKYFGKNYHDRKPFSWQEEFPEVFMQGGFDCIIGNPPYVILDSSNEQLEFFKKYYTSSQGGKTNLYKTFIEKGVELLKKDGLLGFICPSSYLSSADSKTLRRELLEKTNLIEIIEYSEKDRIFEAVTQALTTIIIQKTQNHANHKLHIITKKQGDHSIEQEKINKNGSFELIAKNETIQRMAVQKLKFSDLCEGYQGEINVSTNKDFFTSDEKAGYLPLLRGNNIARYKILDIKEFCPTNIEGREHWKNPRIVLQEVSNQQQERRIKAALAEKSLLCGHTTNYCFPKDNRINIFYILGLLNSKLVDYYFRYFNNTNHVPVGELKNIPFPDASNSQQEIITVMVERLLSLQNFFQKEPENSNEWQKIKEEIAKIDHKIDQEVYKLYALTPEEIRIVEDN